VNKLYKQYCDSEFVTKPVPSQKFKGVRFHDLLDMEELFNIRIVVFKLDKDGEATLEWSSGKKSGTLVNMNIYDDHFSYIKNLFHYPENHL